MLIVHLDIGTMYGDYVFSPFSSMETFYKYVEEWKREFKEEIEEEGRVYPYLCVKKVTSLNKGETIIFCEEGWEQIAPLIKTIDLEDYCGILKNDLGSH